MTDPRSIAIRLFSAINCQTEVSGFCRCSGEALHASRTTPKTCSRWTPTNCERYGKASRVRKRARPWDYRCACDAPGAVAQGDDVICAGCLEKERVRYARPRYSYSPRPGEREV